MRDYRLSEIKNECKKNNGNCRKCRFRIAIGFHNDYECIRHTDPFCWEFDKEEKDGDEE